MNPTVSGQNNAYKYDLHNSSTTSPVCHIWVHTDRVRVEGNYITLGIPDSVKVKGKLEEIRQFVDERLSGLGAYLETWRMPPWANEVSTGRASVNDEAPSHIKVANYIDARRVIDDLFSHSEMSAGNRASIEDAIRELEKSGQYASKVSDVISVAQKEIIQSLVEPYIEDISSEAPDAETAKNWIRCAANALSSCGPSVKKNLSASLWTACNSGHDKSEEFYESLFAIVRVYTSMGDLERTLKELGEGMPSQDLVQQTILELFS